MSYTPHRLLERIWHGPEVFELRFHRGQFPFRPGDCVALFGEDGRTSRPYSLASGIHDDWLGFLIRRMPGGVLSGWLAQIAPGTEVGISAPFGWFRPGDEAVEGPQIFLATGTGVAPFISALRSHPGWRPLHLGVGVRQRADAAWADWLTEFAPLDLCVSREEADGCHHGRVTDLLASWPHVSEAHWYLCGLDAMIDQVTRTLEARGVPRTHIHRECFFNAPADGLPGSV